MIKVTQCRKSGGDLLNDENQGAPPPSEAAPDSKPPSKGVKFAVLVAAGASLLAGGVFLGRHGAAPPVPGGGERAAASTELGGGSPGGGLFGGIGRSKPCVLVGVDSIRDDAPQTFMSALKAKAPSWDISSSLEPGDCEPDMYVVLAAIDVDLSRTEWDTVYNTSGKGAVLAISVPGRSALSVSSSIGEDLDKQIDQLAEDAVKQYGRANLGKPGVKPQIVRDGVTCVQLVGEDEYSQDDRAREMISQMRYWKIAGAEKEDRCKPDLLMARSDIPIKGGETTEGRFIVYAMLNQSASPRISYAWGRDSYQVELAALRGIFSGVPSQIDPDAADQVSQP